MPTTRKRRARGRRREVPAEVLSYFKDDPSAPSFLYFMTDAELRGAWNQAKDEILEEWVREYPGSRPRAWWKYESPEPRRRVGGVGQAAFEVSAYVEQYERGVPDHWVTRADFLSGIVVDPKNPPSFESEAHYLRRLGLLQADELGRLTPADFEPEAVEIAEE